MVAFPKNLSFRNTTSALPELQNHVDINLDDAIVPGELFISRGKDLARLVTVIERLDGEIASVFGTLPQIMGCSPEYTRWNFLAGSAFIRDGANKEWTVNEPFPYNLSGAYLDDFRDVNVYLPGDGPGGPGGPNITLTESIKVGQGIRWTGSEFIPGAGLGADGVFGIGYIPGTAELQTFYDVNWSIDPYGYGTDPETGEPVDPSELTGNDLLLDRTLMVWDQLNQTWTNRKEDYYLYTRSDVKIDPSQLRDSDALHYNALIEKWEAQPIIASGVLAVPDGRRGLDAAKEFIVAPGMKDKIRGKEGQQFGGVYLTENTQIEPYGRSMEFQGEWQGLVTVRDATDGEDNHWQRFPSGAFYFNTGIVGGNDQRTRGSMRLMRDPVVLPDIGIPNYPDYSKPQFRVTDDPDPNYGIYTGQHADNYRGDHTNQFWFRATDFPEQPWWTFPERDWEGFVCTGGGGRIKIKKEYIAGTSFYQMLGPNDYIMVADLRVNTDYHVAISTDVSKRRRWYYVNGKLKYIEEYDDDLRPEGIYIPDLIWGNRFTGYIADIVFAFECTYPDGKSFVPPVGWGRFKVAAPRAAIRTLGVSEKGRFAWVAQDNPSIWHTAFSPKLSRFQDELVDIDVQELGGDGILKWDDEKGKFTPSLNSGHTLMEWGTNYDTSVPKEDYSHFFAIFDPTRLPGGLGTIDGGRMPTVWYRKTPGKAAQGGTGGYRPATSEWRDNNTGIGLYGVGRAGVSRTLNFPAGAYVHRPFYLEATLFADAWSDVGVTELDYEPNGGYGVPTESLGLPDQCFTSAIRLASGMNQPGSRIDVLDHGWFKIQIDAKKVIITWQLSLKENFGSIPEGTSQEDQIKYYGFNNYCIMEFEDFFVSGLVYEFVSIYDPNTGIHFYVNGKRQLLNPYTVPFVGSNQDSNIGMPEYIHSPNRVPVGNFGVFMPGDLDDCGNRIEIGGWALHYRKPHGWDPFVGEMDFSELFDTSSLPPECEYHYSPSYDTPAVWDVKEYNVNSYGKKIEKPGTYRTMISGEGVGPSALGIDRTTFSNFFDIEEDDGYLKWNGGNLSISALPNRLDGYNYYVAQTPGRPYFVDAQMYRTSMQDGQAITWDATNQAWRGIEMTPDVQLVVNEKEKVYNPQQGDLLLWDDRFNKWTNSPDPAKIDYGMGELTDVDVDPAPPKVNSILRFDSAKQRWESKDPSERKTLRDLLDTDIGFFRVDEYLSYNSQSLKWVNRQLKDYSLETLDTFEDVVYSQENIIDGRYFAFFDGAFRDMSTFQYDEIRPTTPFFQDNWQVNNYLYSQASRKIGNFFVVDQLNGLSRYDLGSWVDSGAVPVTSGGDGGNFEYGETMAGMPMLRYGGGNLETGEEDLPPEQKFGLDGGEFGEEPGNIKYPTPERGYTTIEMPFNPATGYNNGEWIYRDTNKHVEATWYVPDLPDWDDPDPIGSGVYPGGYLDGSSPGAALFSNGNPLNLVSNFRKEGLITTMKPEYNIGDKDFTIDLVCRTGSVYNDFYDHVYQYICGTAGEPDLTDETKGRGWALRYAKNGLERTYGEDDSIADPNRVRNDVLVFEFWDEDNVRREAICEMGANTLFTKCEWDNYEFPLDSSALHNWTYLSVQRSVQRKSISFFVNGQKFEFFDENFAKTFLNIIELDRAAFGIGYDPRANLTGIVGGFNGQIESFRFTLGECLYGEGSAEQPSNYFTNQDDVTEYDPIPEEWLFGYEPPGPDENFIVVDIHQLTQMEVSVGVDPQDPPNDP